MTTTYAKRNNLFEKGEREWRITDEALIAREPGGGEDIGPWREITAVRLAFAPTSQKTWRHLMELKFRNGAKWTIDNAHFKGVGDFEDRSASYAPFVREVVAMIHQKSPSAQARTGASPTSYWLNLFFVLLAFSFLVWILLIVPLDGLAGIVWIKLAIILISIPVLFSWVVRARPRRTRLGDIPPDALPKRG